MRQWSNHKAQLWIRWLYRSLYHKNQPTSVNFSQNRVSFERRISTNHETAPPLYFCPQSIRGLYIVYQYHVLKEHSVTPPNSVLSISLNKSKCAKCGKVKLSWPAQSMPQSRRSQIKLARPINDAPWITEKNKIVAENWKFCKILARAYFNWI
jgi:hypothetical protein